MSTEKLEKWIEENKDSAAQFPDSADVVPVSTIRALFAGKVLVPVEPTPEIINSIRARWPVGVFTASVMYQDMITASQEPR